MTIQSICTNHVVTVEENATVEEVVYLMEVEGVGSVVVMDEEREEPIGIITDRDIVLKVIPERKAIDEVTAGEIMNTDLLVVNKEKNITDTLLAMQEKGVRRAPVVDQNKKLCGIITVDDLVVMLSEELNILSKLVQIQAPQPMKGIG